MTGGIALLRIRSAVVNAVATLSVWTLQLFLNLFLGSTMEKGGEMPDSESEWRDERISEFKYLRTCKLKVPEHVRTSRCFRPEGRTRRLKPFLVALPFASILFVHHASTWIAKSGVSRISP